MAFIRAMMLVVSAVPLLQPKAEGTDTKAKEQKSSIAQQPDVTILQQMPWTPSAFLPSSRTGQIREDLMDLMMIQNAQMHQVIMNNLAVSALAYFGHNLGQPSAQVSHTAWQVEEDDEEDEPVPLVFHHHYGPYPRNIPYMAWRPQSQSLELPRQQPTIRHVGPAPQGTGRQDGQAVPPPPPPSATGTVTADIPPASEYYDFAEGRK